jgi:PAS domain S-box-containing protein
MTESDEGSSRSREGRPGALSAKVPERVWRELFESASEPQLVTDSEGRVVAANQTAVEILESTECPLLGTSVATLADEEERPRLRALLRRLARTRAAVLETEIGLRSEGGETTRVPVTLIGVRDDDDHLAAVSWTLRADERPGTLLGRLQRTRQEASDLRRALDQATAVLELDREGHVSEANERSARLLRRPREELLGCALEQMGFGSGLTQRLPEIRRRLIRGRAWGGEIPVVVAERDERWINATVVPLLDKDVRPRGYVVLFHDVTRRRQALDRLERERRLARLGTMAAVVAHEVRNPLAAAQGALEVIGPRVPAKGDREVLADVIQRLSSLNRLVQEILLYARPRPLELQEADLADLVRRVVEEARDDPGMERMALILGDIPERCPARLDPAALHGVVLNLLQNAASATQGPGRVQVDIGRETDRSWLRVRDDGEGIPEELKEKVFEPFFTTRHGGSGLGLAVARHTVEQHGGRLSLEPAPGGGTDALVELPLHPSPDAATEHED